MRTAGAGLHPSALPLQGSGGRSRASEEPDQVDGALESGARVCGDEAEVRICEATLPRAKEKRRPAIRGVRARELVFAEENTLAPGAGLSPAAQGTLIASERRSGSVTGKDQPRMLAMAG